MIQKFERFREDDFMQMDEWIQKFIHTLEVLTQESFYEQKTQQLVASLLNEQDENGFWGIIPSPRVDGDIRVDYWYKPTYIATAYLMKYWLIAKRLYEPTDHIEERFKKGLQASTGRGFNGHGHDDIKGRLESVAIFKKAQVADFLKVYPTLCQNFTTVFNSVLESFRNALDNNLTKGDWGEDYKNEMIEALQGFSNEPGVLIFVYGTLKKGERNHEAFLSKAQFITNGVIVGYTLYDLGYFPGIKKTKKGVVEGEVYRVSLDTLHQIDLLEDEGDLYSRVTTDVIGNGLKLHNVQTYVYNPPIPRKRSKNTADHVHGISKDTHVWYAVYGSNLLYERFSNYILGGVCPFNEKEYPGCTDKTMPIKNQPYEIPFNMYYGNAMSSWGQGGVSFLDISQPGKSLGRIYLITKEQFREINEQEGSSERWYHHTLALGELEGIPIMTVTNQHKRPVHPPSDAYLEVLRLGLKETYPNMSEYDRLRYML